MFLGVNFGHDASLTLLDYSGAVSFIELERSSRLKHQVGVTQSCIEQFLKENDVCLKDITCIGLTGTQFYTARTSKIKISETHSTHKGNKWYTGSFEATSNWYDYSHHRDFLGIDNEFSFPSNLYDTLKTFRKSHANLCKIAPLEINTLITYELSVSIGGHNCKGFYIPHHLSHAYYAAAHHECQNGDIIISHDGGWPHLDYNSSGIFMVQDDFVVPVIDPKLWIGQLYQQLGEAAGFKPSEAPGKLMGLASYGKLCCHNVVDTVAAPLLAWQANEVRCVETFRDALDQTLSLAQSVEDHEFTFHTNHSFTDFPIQSTQSVKLAILAQRIAEKLWADTVVHYLRSMQDEADHQKKSVHLVGGFTLNCPANTLLSKKLRDRSTYVYPGGSDMGLSIGAATAVARLHSFTRPQIAHRTSAFLERTRKPKNTQILHPKSPSFVSKKHAKFDPDSTAKAVVDKKIICVVDGLPEIGPRALGHRSIIAHAVSEEIRNRINRNKGREDWRPLAPMVLEDDYPAFFEGEATGHEHMLRVSIVKKPDILRGVTHIDGTARVQVVTSSSPVCYEILHALKAAGEVPVLINTSFNQAGQPLVDNELQALKAFRQLNFDLLIIGRQKLTKKEVEKILS